MWQGAPLCCSYGLLKVGAPTTSSLAPAAEATLLAYVAL